MNKSVASLLVLACATVCAAVTPGINSSFFNASSELQSFPAIAWTIGVLAYAFASTIAKDKTAFSLAMFALGPFALIGTAVEVLTKVCLPAPSKNPKLMTVMAFVAAWTIPLLNAGGHLSSVLDMYKSQALLPLLALHVAAAFVPRYVMERMTEGQTQAFRECAAYWYAMTPAAFLIAAASPNYFVTSIVSSGLCYMFSLPNLQPRETRKSVSEQESAGQSMPGFDLFLKEKTVAAQQ